MSISALYLRNPDFLGFKLKQGGLAHLVERKHGMFEVIGSSPISSTLIPQCYLWNFFMPLSKHNLALQIATPGKRLPTLWHFEIHRYNANLQMFLPYSKPFLKWFLRQNHFFSVYSITKNADCMQQIQLENLFLIDIETVSEKENFNLLDDEWKELWATKIKKNLPPNTTAEEYYPMRAAILAEFAKVVCISFGYLKKENNNWQLRIKSLCSESEADILNEFIDTLKQLHNINHQWIFTGHNIKEFDLPFLCRRMLVNEITIPAYIDFQNKKPWETPVIDTLHLWRFGDYKHYTSLKLLAATLGAPSPKDDIDGSQVGDVYWKEKNLSRISIYCEKDVVTVANLMMRFKGLPILNKNQVIFVDRINEEKGTT